VIARGYARDTRPNGQPNPDPTPTFSLLRFTTDRRSSKVQEMRNDPRVEVLWWDAKAEVQYRIRGVVHVLTHDATPDETTELSTQDWRGEFEVYWERILKPEHRIFWAMPSTGPMPTNLSNDEIDNLARDNFCLCYLDADEVDCVKLLPVGTQHELYKRVDGKWTTNVIR